MAKDDLPESLRLGIPEVDVEHLLQVQILQSITDALAQGDGEQAYELIRQLEDVTAAHFIAEQLLMRLHAYPGYQQHEREHDQLIDELRNLEEQIVAGEGDAAAETRALELWLVHHIHTADKAFGAFMLDREGGSSSELQPA
jgi:hemerythrin